VKVFFRRLLGPTEATGRRGWLSTAAAIAVAAALSFHGLGNHLLWDDEANTALFGRNLLETGELTAWDGRNLVGFRGGGELDERLHNVYMPPLQYWVAAGAIATLGQSAFAVRVPFLLLGLAAIAVLALLARRLLGDDFPWALPAWLAALSPAYLLYIRNCRYYAPGVLLYVALLAAFAARLETRRSLLINGALALLATAGLALTNYIYAACAAGALPLFFLLRRFRDRRHMLLLVAVAAVAAGMALRVYLQANPLETTNIREDTTPPLERFFTLLGWHLTGLGTFEFLPPLLLPAAALPLASKRLFALKPTATRSALAAAAILVAVVLCAALSPQSVSGSMVADMRYLVPLILVGTLVAAAALRSLWHFWKPLAVAALGLTVFSNIPELGFTGDDNGFVEAKDVQCTLCRYVAENLENPVTNTERVVSLLREAPDDTEVLIVPTYMGYSPMYHRPGLRYCCQLEEDHPLEEDLRFELDDHVLWSEASPELGLISSVSPPSRSGPLVVNGQNLGTFTVIGMLDARAQSTSRPEIPWHAFDEEEQQTLSRPPFLVVEITR
jgi:4-amino-4-deoxy-L-arabinose transferase-like glycosyltransferase